MCLQSPGGCLCVRENDKTDAILVAARLLPASSNDQRVRDVTRSFGATFDRLDHPVHRVVTIVADVHGSGQLPVGRQVLKPSIYLDSITTRHFRG